MAQGSTRQAAGRGPLAVLAGRAPDLRAALIFAASCALLVAGIRLYLSQVGPWPGDGWMAQVRVNGWKQPAAVQDLNVFFQVAATPVVAVLTVLVALPFAARAGGGRAVVYVVLASAGVVVNAGLKVLLSPTPLMADLHTGELNFPSGHTVYAVVCFGALAVLARRARRLDIAVPLVLLIVAMGVFRVTCGAHYVSDVVAAYLVGAAWLVLATALAG